MYDPIELSKKTEKITTNGSLKKYYRFRPTRFYGGIATADTVGCNLRCKFCWSSQSVWETEKTGKYYSPEQVVDKIQRIAFQKKYNRLRISGGEPTIGKNHLIQILEKIDDNFLFILETNGILLGHDISYIETISKYKNLHIRICLKGCDSEEFSFLTGARYGFDLQMKSLIYLKDKNVNFNIAFVTVSNNKEQLYLKLEEIGLDKIMIEEEDIKMYPSVRDRLEKLGIRNHFENK